jgi:Cdc6-like AAA superfamily ATPase
MSSKLIKRLKNSTNVNNENANCEAYSEAKKALNASAPDRVVCRQKELDELYNLTKNCVNPKKPQTICLYINGQPGTGKTLSVNSTLESLKVKIEINSF